MTADVYPLRVLLVTSLARHQQHLIEYLVEEDRVLKAQLKGPPAGIPARWWR